jgi:hypothetical protein
MSILVANLAYRIAKLIAETKGDAAPLTAFSEGE